MRSRRVAGIITGVLVGALYVGTATVVSIRWLDVGENDARSLNHFFAATFVDMVDGHAYRPFVTRALVPGTIHVLHEVLPPHCQIVVQRTVVHTFHLRGWMAGLGWEPERTFDYVVFGAITLLAFAVVPFAVRAAFCALFVARRFWVDFAVLPLLPVPLLGDRRMMYDPTTLALSALGTYAAVARRGRLFYVVYLLAVVNKETALLLAALFLIARGSAWRKHVLPLGGIWLVVRIGLSWVFRDNPGGPAYWLWRRNVTQALGDPWGVAVLCIVIAVAIWSAWRWRSVRAIRLGVPVLVAVEVGAYLTLGRWGEYRVFYEVVALTWVTVYAAVLLSCRVSIRARNGEASPAA